MRTLADIQEAICIALVNGDSTAVAPLLNGGAHPERRLAIHQRHYAANVVTRSGFERTREADVLANYGNYNETNDQFSLGDHTDRLPLKGERDEQYEIGVAIPVRAWAIDVDAFRTNATNFFDHDAIGNSNIFIPLTIETARIRGWEATVRSPRRGHAQAHLAYSHQFVEGRGAVSGGLTAFEPPSDDFFFLDHDQRDTLGAGVDAEVSAGAWVSVSIDYGSGFLEGDGPDHKPAHAVVNLQGSKTFGKQWTVIVTALNLGDTRFLLDESNTFGGTHFNSPRQVSAGIRYRFHY